MSIDWYTISKFLWSQKLGNFLRICMKSLRELTQCLAPFKFIQTIVSGQDKMFVTGFIQEPGIAWFIGTALCHSTTKAFFNQGK
jgi:hypothetical protein